MEIEQPKYGFVRYNNINGITYTSTYTYFYRFCYKKKIIKAIMKFDNIIITPVSFKKAIGIKNNM